VLAHGEGALVSPSLSIPDAVLKDTFKTMFELAGYWNEELPLRIHQRALDDGGVPDWHGDFALWLGRANVFDDRKWREHPEPRVKTTRAFRKLRKFAPREFEVVYRTAILHIPVRDTMFWLNDRAIRNGKPERYGLEETLLLLVSGVDKVAHWFSA
jgi:hypothetical protein